ncbi:Growth-regulating factor 1 [Platanthera guangdongensis]|uniref:Growth-regulating factor n=1 Tax=Platanthera guangdongensis TaxID=2320717 RepID=A0ABR2LIH7_9ASPA
MQCERSSSRYPFTASQWQELEHQALIYKYMVSGIPIPSDLLLPIRRSFLLESTRISPSLAFPPHTPCKIDNSVSLSPLCFITFSLRHHNMLWFQWGGTAFRWDSEEKQRIRNQEGAEEPTARSGGAPRKLTLTRSTVRGTCTEGKNRSRKPVEISLATNTYTSPSSSTHYPLPASHSISSPDNNPIVYPYSTASRPTNHHSLDSVTYSVGNYRYGEGMKHLERNAMFSGANGSAEREHPSQVKTRGALSFMVEENQKSYCLSKEEEEERKRPLRHFFD